MITKIIRRSLIRIEFKLSADKLQKINKNNKYLQNLNQINLSQKFINSMMYYFATNKNQNSLLKTYERIKQKQQNNKSTSITNTQQTLQPNQQQTKSSPQHTHPQTHSIRCQGCNVYLQSSDRTKYGFIQDKLLKQAIQQNKKQIDKTFTTKINQDKDSKMLNFLHEVQKQSGVKIFNQKTKQLQNLENIQILMRLQDKIDKYQAQQQLLHRSKNKRKQLLCFRCFSLKYHNRLPQQYDNNLSFTTDTTQFILNKMLNRHKNQKIQYLFLIDAFDVLGTFQQWLFKRLFNQKLQISIIVNKIDVINKIYLNQAAIHTGIKLKLRNYLKGLGLNVEEVQKKMEEIRIFYISCNSRDGIKKLKEYLQGNTNNIQLVGYPNTGKTTLLNILGKLKKSTSKMPGTTIKITQHDYKNSSRKIYDMPGLYSPNLLYNLIQKPSLKSILTWHKKIAPGLLTHYAFIYGGKLQIIDVRIIIFGQGGACQSSNRWFIDNYQQFWKGLPQPKQLKIKKYQSDLQFINGRTDDLQIAGYGFIGFRLCIPHIKNTKRKLTLYLPQKVQFAFRPSILTVDDGIFHNRSAITKRFMLERLTLDKYQNKSKNQQKYKINTSKRNSKQQQKYEEENQKSQQQCQQGLQADNIQNKVSQEDKV